MLFTTVRLRSTHSHSRGVNYGQTVSGGGGDEAAAAATAAAAAATAAAAAAIGGGDVTEACKVGVLVPPTPGDAVFFYNFEPEGGEVDPTAIHAACQVTGGVKWAANHWFNLPEHSPPPVDEDDKKSEL